MHTQYSHYLGASIALGLAFLSGCSGTDVTVDEADVAEVEQELRSCSTQPCPSGTTCVFGACRTRCDTSNGGISDTKCESLGLSQCCPGVFNPSTGVGSAPYCSNNCDN